jgi:hypothetical protein
LHTGGAERFGLDRSSSAIIHMKQLIGAPVVWTERNFAQRHAALGMEVGLPHVPH